jgi:glycosyltransferase involved in cell wall biosynthesis
LYKILHVIDSAGYGGGERYLLDLIGHRSLDLQHFILLPQTGFLQFELGRIDCSHAIVDLQQRFSLNGILQIHRYIRQFKPDIIHSHGYRANFYSRLAATIGGVPHVCTVHVSLYDYIDTPISTRLLYIMVERVMAVLSRRFLCISKSMSADMRRLGVGEEKIVEIPNGVDTQRFKQITVSETVKHRMGVIDGGPVIGTVGRLVAEKGQKYLIDAVAAIQPEFPNLTCLFIGDGPALEELKRRAEARGVMDRCRFPGTVSDMESIYPVMDIFVLPSIREPFGLVLLEAMASGVAVVATDAGGPRDFIDSGQNGMLVAPMDVAALAKAVDGMLRDDSFRHRMAVAGCETARNRFDILKTVEGIESVYRTIMKSENFRGC